MWGSLAIPHPAHELHEEHFGEEFVAAKPQARADPSKSGQEQAVGGAMGSGVGY